MPEKLDILKNQLFENIFNRASNGIAVVGLDYKWIKVNQSLLDLLGYSEVELYEMTFKDITHKDDLDIDMFELNELLERRIDRYQIEKRYFHKNGAIIWVLVSVSMEVDEYNLPHYFVSQIMDISKRKEMDWQINAMSKIVKKQNEKLTNFAHIATHDMRTHLGNLNTISEFMEQEIEGINSDANFIMLKASLKQFEATLLNLNQVRQLDFSAEDNRKSLNLFTFVSNGIYNVNAIAKIQKCEIINSVNETIEVLATEVFLDSIILNILTNAIKYKSHHRPCRIEISTEIEHDTVILKIKDNGLGIDMNKHEHSLFSYGKTFHQRNDARGIGLFITKNHVESLGGRISVDSAVDKGSTFSIQLNMA